MRGEPLDTLDRIQEAYIQAKQEELESLSAKFLDPRRLQIIVVADKTTPVNKESGKVISLEEDLKTLARNSISPTRNSPEVGRERRARAESKEARPDEKLPKRAVVSSPSDGAGEYHSSRRGSLKESGIREACPGERHAHHSFRFHQ